MSSGLLLLTAAFCTGQCLLVRETVFGNVRGKISTRVPERQVEEYLGIPYASPPIGHLRFKRPQDPMIWEPLVLETTELPPACPQPYIKYIDFHKPGFMNFDEDCLYMNIYVPKVDKVALPVLFFIHGGGNAVGMGAMFDGDILAAHGEIIVITFNYRLNDLGFYADPSIGIKGNNGLMDQVLAMKWVNRNIEYFNGDPSKVTIHGHSAGAIDAALHLLSNLTEGLFRNAIIHSCSPFSILALSPCVRTTRVSAIPEDCIPGTSYVYRDEEQDAINKLIEGGAVHEYLSTNRPVNNWIVVDGDFLTDSPEYLFTCGNFHADSVLIMMTRDESWPLDMSELEEMGERHSLFNKTAIIEGLASLFPERPEFKDAIKEELKKWKTLDLSRYPEGYSMVGTCFTYLAYQQSDTQTFHTRHEMQMCQNRQ
ncbi:neuroligin-2-like isoform X2 [Mytilus trossulus]|uniref:neuroligin-2-like isoform X2 n=1 Tax=Mytilus trossulus TaxID=6551 RepID=UPI00300755A3